MRRRFPDDADTRLYLSRFLQAVDRADLPGHSAALLYHISAQSGGRAEYSAAALECKLNEGQMERAVAALAAKELIVRVDNHADARRLDLQITRTGEDVIGEINDDAQRK